MSDFPFTAVPPDASSSSSSQPPFTSIMLSAKPMQLLAEISLPTSSPPDPSSPSMDHLLTSTGSKPLKTAQPSLVSSHLSSFVGSTTSQTHFQLCPANDPSTATAADKHIFVTSYDDGKLAPMNSSGQVSLASISIPFISALYSNTARFSLPRPLPQIHPLWMETFPEQALQVLPLVLPLAFDFRESLAHHFPTPQCLKSFHNTIAQSPLEKVRLPIHHHNNLINTGLCMI